MIKKINNGTINKNYVVSRTGSKEQCYTLYLETCVELQHITINRNMYFRNLSFDSKVAFEKAKEIAKDWPVELIQTPRYVYEDFIAFGMHFNKNKNNTVYYTTASSEFWEAWKKDKKKIKDDGFWLNKSDDGSWTVFHKCVSLETIEEEYIEYDYEGTK